MFAQFFSQIPASFVCKRKIAIEKYQREGEKSEKMKTTKQMMLTHRNFSLNDDETAQKNHPNPEIINSNCAIFRLLDQPLLIRFLRLFEEKDLLFVIFCT